MKRAWLGVALAVGFGCGSDEAETPRDANEMTYVRVPAKALTRDVVDSTGFVRDHKRDVAFALGYVPKDRLALLEAYAGDVVELDAKAVAHGTIDPVTLASPSVIHETILAEPYHDYDALTAELEGLAADSNGNAMLFSAGKSVQGREQWVLKISDNAEMDENEPKLLYIANMHGDETAGREMMVYLARELVNDVATDPRIAKLVQSAQIYIMPSMNPDGFEAAERWNSDGVDLNRDFPDFTADPTDTPAGRAIETKNVMKLHDQNHFVVAVNFHGGEVCFNVPWDTRENGTPAKRFGDDVLMMKVGRAYADSNATMKANDGASFDHGLTYGYEWYEVDGGMQDWANYYRNSFHATVELSLTKYPSTSFLASVWQENHEAMLSYLEAGAFGVHAEVEDAGGKPISGVTARVSTLPRDVKFAGSVIHRLSLGGEQTMTVSAPGFAPKTVPVTPEAFSGGLQKIQLSKAP